MCKIGVSSWVVRYTLLQDLNRKYDVCSYLSQSEDLNAGVLSLKTEFMNLYE